MNSDQRQNYMANLIMAIEKDLRNIIRENIIPHFNDFSFVKSNFAKNKALERYKTDYPKSYAGNDLDNFINFFDWFEQVEIIMSNKEYCSEYCTKLKEFKLVEGFEKTTSIRNRAMHSRVIQGDFENFVDFIELMKESSITWEKLELQLEQLEYGQYFSASKNTAFELYQDDHSNVEHNLPPGEHSQTGFIGRKKDINRLKELILSPTSVISIIGEGGLGKTALCLEVLYSLIDEIEGYDSIIWISAKSSIFNSSGINQIYNCIKDLDGITDVLASQLGITDSNATEAIYEYIQTYKTIIVLDNLESIKTNEVRDFIREIQLYSKIIITSRIGLGELEYPYHLKPMTPEDARHLLIAQAKADCVMNVISPKPDTEKDKILKKLFYNPLWIKWYVQSIQAGKSSDEILSNTDNIEQYCLSSIYELLNDNERDVLKVILAYRKHMTIGEITYFSNMSSVEVEKTILKLISTSFIVKEPTKRKGEDSEFKYYINSISYDFLNKNYPANNELIREINNQKASLQSKNENAIEYTKKAPFDIQAFQTFNRSNKLQIPHLFNALRLTKKARRVPETDLNKYNDLVQKANDHIAQAKRIDIGYIEIYLVEGFIRDKLENNLTQARTCYEKAFEIDPKNLRCLYFFADFLLHSYEDLEESLNYANLAHNIDPDEVAFKILLGQLHGFLRDYEKATKILLDAYQEDDLLVYQRSIIITRYLDFKRRSCELLLSTKNFIEVVEICVSAIEFYENIEYSELIDWKIEEILIAILTEYKSAITQIQKTLPEEYTYFVSKIKKYQNIVIERGSRQLKSYLHNILSADPESNSICRGQIYSTIQPSFFFIKPLNADRLTIYCNEINVISPWTDFKQFSFVEFKTRTDEVEKVSADNDNCNTEKEIKLSAFDVKLISEEQLTDSEIAFSLKSDNVNSNEKFQGIIYSIRDTFGFIIKENKDRVYFNKKAFLSEWKNLREGDRVSFSIGSNQQGECALNVDFTT